MKRMLALLLVLLLGAAACAETRENTIYMEGEPEPVTETLYRTGLGFSFWYDAERMEVDETLSEDGNSVMISAAQSDLPICMELLTSDTAGELPWKFLELNADADTEYDYGETESGAAVVGFVKAASFDSEIYRGYYAVEGDADFIVATATCPAEALEGYMVRFRHLLSTVSFDGESAGGTQTVHVDWADGIARDLTPSDRFDAEEQPGSEVVFTSSVPVYNFEFLALSLVDFGDDGRAQFDIETLYAQELLAPDSPLAVGLTFYGDMPEYGIRYVDSAGNMHTFALEMSGEDGSLYLWEF